MSLTGVYIVQFYKEKPVLWRLGRKYSHVSRLCEWLLGPYRGTPVKTVNTPMGIFLVNAPQNMIRAYFIEVCLVLSLGVNREIIKQSFQ